MNTKETIINMINKKLKGLYGDLPKFYDNYLSTNLIYLIENNLPLTSVDLTMIPTYLDQCFVDEVNTYYVDTLINIYKELAKNPLCIWAYKEPHKDVWKAAQKRMSKAIINYTC